MESDLRGLVEFFHLVERLKLERRKGWANRGMKQAESVADHSFRLVLMAMVFAERQGLDAGKAVNMALVHDLPEAVVGDIVANPGDEDNVELCRAKHEREERALEEILANLDGKAAEKIRALWQEFEKRESKEASLVYELDRLEAIFQAQEYANRQELRARLQVFFDYGDSRLKNKELREVFGLLLEEMKKAK